MPSDPAAPNALRLPPDFDPAMATLIRRVAPYTMTGPERLFALRSAVRYLVAAGVPGDVVECGVWRGGSMMAAALTLLECGAADRVLHLFDTFDGMPPPTDVDKTFYGAAAADLLDAGDKATDAVWAWCSQPDVEAAMRSTGYDPRLIRFIPGRVEDTLPVSAPDVISLLRLDTDWYESTLHELTHLYPRLSVGGVLIIDDYGHWQGARRAVDEYMAAHGLKLLLHRIDYTARIAIKLRP